MKQVDRVLANINNLKNWQVALVITAIGMAVYAIGLKNPFQGDDILQIVNNVPVHSIKNIKLLFEGGTFYSGGGLTRLSGVYYRPLMMTTFALIYTIFGPHPFYYHLVQLLLCIGSSYLLYMFFRYSFKPVLALFLALVFLVHPIDSQLTFAIPSMQDALYFFFGILALWILVRYRSNRSLIAVIFCLFLSLLAKETGFLFVIMSCIYLVWWNRKRLFLFLTAMIIPTALWIFLKIKAVGLNHNPGNTPIDKLNLGGRLLTAPSIIEFYITKFIFPWKLSQAYYWVYPSYSIKHTLIPLIVDLITLALIVYLSQLIRRKASKSMYYTYIFFAIWCVLGSITYLQIIPLDFTANEPWFYFSMAGVLGMIGVLISSFKPPIRSEWLLVVAAIIVCSLGLRTAFRGHDWRNQYSLAFSDISASPDDFYALNIIEGYQINQGNFQAAENASLRSISILPTYPAYSNLGLAQVNLGNDSAAFNSYINASKFYLGNNSSTYEELGELTLATGSFSYDQHFFTTALQKYPHDTALWVYLAFLDKMHGDNSGAISAVNNAAKYGSISQQLYDDVTATQPFTVNLPDIDKVLKIP